MHFVFPQCTLERWQSGNHVNRFSSWFWFVCIPSKRTFQNQELYGKVDGSSCATVYDDLVLGGRFFGVCMVELYFSSIMDLVRENFVIVNTYCCFRSFYVDWMVSATSCLLKDAEKRLLLLSLFFCLSFVLQFFSLVD